MKSVTEMSDRHLRRLLNQPDKTIVMDVSYMDITNPADENEVIILAHTAHEKHSLHQIIRDEQFRRWLEHEN